MTKIVEIDIPWFSFVPNATSLHQTYIDVDDLNMWGAAHINLDHVQSYTVETITMKKQVRETQKIKGLFGKEKTVRFTRLVNDENIDLFNVKMADGTKYKTSTNIHEAMIKAGLAK